MSEESTHPRPSPDSSAPHFLDFDLRGHEPRPPGMEDRAYPPEPPGMGNWAYLLNLPKWAVVPPKAPG